MLRRLCGYALTAPHSETDEGHRILDCHVPGGVDDPELTSRRLKAIPGVVETGLFLGLCDILVIGHVDRVETVGRPSAQ